MKRFLLGAFALASCGGPRRPTPVATIQPVTVDAGVPVAIEDAAAKTDPTLVVTMRGKINVPAHLISGPFGSLIAPVGGVSFTPDGARVGVIVGGTLVLYDAATLQEITGLAGGTLAQAPGPMLVIAGRAFEPSNGAELTVRVAAPFACTETSFSQDGSRMAAYCSAAGKDGVLVFDTRTGRKLGLFSEFQTAAPVRTGRITASGNFIFWQSRASGAFEEIKSHVSGPVMSSHSVMSPDERFIFTAPDRDWYTDAVPTGQLIDPKNGRPKMAIQGDVEGGTFSPSSHMLAVFRAKRTDSSVVPLAVTLHATDHDGVLATLATPAASVAFSPDDKHLAAVTAGLELQLYDLETR